MARLFERHLAFAPDGRIAISKKVLLKADLNFDEISFSFAYLRRRGVYSDFKEDEAYIVHNNDVFTDDDDCIYRLTVDAEKLRSFLASALSKNGDVQSKFDEATSILKIGFSNIEIPPGKNEFYFCRALFKRPVNTFIDWSEISEEIDGDFDIAKKEKAKKKIRDTMRSIHKRIEKITDGKAEPLFLWRVKSVKRNY